MSQSKITQVRSRMSQSVINNIKHFVLVCLRTPDSALIEKTIASIGFPLCHKLDNSEAVFMALPRTTSDHMSTQFETMVCGDAQDLNPAESLFLGNGIHITKDSDGSLLLASSLTSLPPLYIYRDSHCAIIADNIESIASVPCSSLHFDLKSVAELAKIGAPINHRTLFKEINIIPAASLVSVSGNEINIKENAWIPSHAEPYDNLESYVESMSGMMHAAVSRMDIEHAFLALTAGLDTRAVLASLADMDKLISSFTISGSDLTLDAMRAKQLCLAYDIPHTIVSIDNALSGRLPEYTNIASRFSGGLNSIEQATELYLYEMAGKQFDGRLSGNLGNQIGRSGTEGTGIRNAPTDSLGGDMESYLKDLDERHWFFQVNEGSDLLSPEFLIQRENLFAQLGNYSIGHEMVTQHTPYADRMLIEGKYREPLATRDNPVSIKAIKMRDLKHRLLGQSPARSFQCRTVQRAGGAVASTPINWGWTTRGGFSVKGLYYGFKAFSDIVIGNRLNRIPGMPFLLKASGIKGFSSFHTQHILYTQDMQQYIKEVFSRKGVRECGLFDTERLDYLINHGFSGTSHYHEIVLTLDLALASENFSATV